MAQIPNLQSTDTLGVDDQAILRQGTIDKRISLNLSGILSWARRNDYEHLGEHSIGVEFPDTESFTTYLGKTYFVDSGVTLPYTSTSNDPTTDINLYSKAGAITTRNLPHYTGIVYRSSGSNCAVDNMVSGFPLVTKIGDICSCENGTIFKRISNNSNDISDFINLNYINVKDFGAVGDGVSDDTESIQSAINMRDWGHTVFIPSGQFLVSNLTIDRNMALKGEGIGSQAIESPSFPLNTKYRGYGGTVLVSKEGSSGWMLSLTINLQAGSGMVDHEYNNQVEVENLTFLDNRVNDIGGINVSRTWHSNYSKLNFIGLKRGAINNLDYGRESNYTDIYTLYCGNWDSTDIDNSWAVFDFGHVSRNDATYSYPNNFNFNNILTVYNFGSAFRADNTANNLPGVNGLRISNWYNHGMLAAASGSVHTMTQDQEDNLVIMDMRGVGNLQVSNSQISITGANAYHVILGQSTEGTIPTIADFSNCNFDGWYGGLTGKRSVFTDGYSISSFSSCVFGNADDGALTIEGNAEVNLSGGNTYTGNTKVVSEGSRPANHNLYGVLAKTNHNIIKDVGSDIGTGSNWSASNATATYDGNYTVIQITGGNNYGFIYQVVPTVVGQKYTLYSDLLGGTAEAEIKVGSSYGGVDLGRTGTTNSKTALAFTATSTSTYITCSAGSAVNGYTYIRNLGCHLSARTEDGEQLYCGTIGESVGGTGLFVVRDGLIIGPAEIS